MAEEEKSLATWMMRVEGRLSKLEADVDMIKKILIIILADIIGCTFAIVMALIRGG